MLPIYVKEVIEDLIYAGIEFTDGESIERFFGNLWVDGEVEFRFGAWGAQNAAMMDLLFIVNESATDADKEKLTWLIEFLKGLDGSRNLKFARIQVAYPKVM